MLTERQIATFEFIREFHRQNRYAPKLTEIAAGIGIRSKGVVHRYLKAIEQEGLIEVIPGRSRGIRISNLESENTTQNTSLPLVGKIAAGKPIEAISDQSSFDLTEFFLGPNRFVLKVQGDSMIEAGILDGDMVIVEKRSTANNGDIIVALIDNDEATLKFIQPNIDDSITLVPANQSLQPVSYSSERIQIQGVVVGQMRCYEKVKYKHAIR